MIVISWPAGDRASQSYGYEIEWKKEGYARLREARKRENYQSMASMKREAKAKKKYGRWGANLFLPSKLDLDLKRLNETGTLRHHDEEDTA
jgi:hypothetical protein